MYKPDFETLDWSVGSKYTYPTKEECIMYANAAKSKGYEVKFGLSKYSGYPFFVIVDPFCIEND